MGAVKIAADFSLCRAAVFSPRSACPSTVPSLWQFQRTPRTHAYTHAREALNSNSHRNEFFDLVYVFGIALHYASSLAPRAAFCCEIKFFPFDYSSSRPPNRAVRSLCNWYSSIYSNAKRPHAAYRCNLNFVNFQWRARRFFLNLFYAKKCC